MRLGAIYVLSADGRAHQSPNEALMLFAHLSVFASAQYECALCATERQFEAKVWRGILRPPEVNQNRDPHAKPTAGDD